MIDDDDECPDVWHIYEDGEQWCPSCGWCEVCWSLLCECLELG